MKIETKFDFGQRVKVTRGPYKDYEGEITMIISRKRIVQYFIVADAPKCDNVRWIDECDIEAVAHVPKINKYPDFEQVVDGWLVDFDPQTGSYTAICDNETRTDTVGEKSIGPITEGDEKGNTRRGKGERKGPPPPPAKPETAIIHVSSNRVELYPNKKREYVYTIPANSHTTVMNSSRSKSVKIKVRGYSFSLIVEPGESLEFVPE